MARRSIEVFSAGCPLCKSAVEKIRGMACPSCEITVLDMNNLDGAGRAKNLGIMSVPAVAVNGNLVECCTGRGINPDALRRAGVGSPIGEL